MVPTEERWCVGVSFLKVNIQVVAMDVSRIYLDEYQSLDSPIPHHSVQRLGSKAGHNSPKIGTSTLS
jgi:hypothetical protein